jgi:hypothetical protein
MLMLQGDGPSRKVEVGGGGPNSAAASQPKGLRKFCENF